MNQWNCNCDAVYEMGEMNVGTDEVFHYATTALSDTQLCSLIARLENALVRRGGQPAPRGAAGFPLTQPAEAVSDVVG